jgi:hypothetical protein
LRKAAVRSPETELSLLTPKQIRGKDRLSQRLMRAPTAIDRIEAVNLQKITQCNRFKFPGTTVKPLT